MFCEFTILLRFHIGYCLILFYIGYYLIGCFREVVVKVIVVDMIMRR
jgi:hypothetical protein